MNRAAEIRAEVAEEHPGAEVIERGLRHIRHRVGVRKYTYDGVIGVLHYQDDKGKWQEIDDDLVDGGEDGFVARSEHTKHLLRIADDGARRLYPDRYDLTRYVEFSGLPNAGGHARHSNHLAWDRPHFAAKILNGPDCLKFLFVLKDEQAPTSISFNVSLVGLTRKGRDLLADGVPVLEVLKPTAVDAEGTERACTFSLTNSKVTLSLDTTGLVFPITIDPTTVDKQVAAQGDDGYVQTGSETFDNTSTVITLGTPGYIGYQRHAFFRFLGVTIAGTVNTSYIQLYANIGANGTPLWKVCAVDADNHAAPTTYAEYIADVQTTAQVDWDGGIATGSFQSSPSLNAIFAELIASYTISNDAIIIQVREDGAGNYQNQDVRTYDNTTNPTHTWGAKLHIEYTTSVQTPKAVAGTCGALTGTVTRPCTRRRTAAGTMGALTGVVTRNHRRVRALAGTMGALTGAVVHRANKSLKGTVGALTGVALHRANKNLAGTIAPTGVVHRAISKTLTGTCGALVGAVYLSIKGHIYLSGTVGALSGTLTKRTNKVLSGVTGALSGTMTRVVPYRRLVSGVLGALSGTLVRQTNKPLQGSIDVLTGKVSKLTTKTFGGTVGALTGSLRRLTHKGVAGELSSLIGALIPSLIKHGAATLLGGGTFIVSGLTFTPVQGGRLYIEIYDSLGNKLGSGPIFQVQGFRFTKRLDKGGDFEFEMPAADDRAILIEQGREIRVYREGEGEIYRGLIEKSMWEIT